MRYDNEEWCTIWNRIDFPVQNWHKEYNKFWPEHSKVSKICTLMVSFWPKYIMLQLEKVKRSRIWWHSRLIQSLKENWLGLPKTDMTNLANFHHSTESLHIRTLMASFCLKLKMLELKIYREITCYDNEEWCENWRGIDLSVKMEIRNLTNFDQSIQKSQTSAL